MTDREFFLVQIGDPSETRALAESLEADRLARWREIKDEFYTKAGKPRKTPASTSAQAEYVRLGRIQSRCRALRFLAQAQQYFWDDPHSHTRPGQENALQNVADYKREADEYK